MFEDILSAYGYLGLFALSLGVNLLPFASPSNLVLAGATAFLFPQMDPVMLGLTVAVAASVAKTGHYYVASYLGAKAGDKAEKLGSYGKKLGRWGALAAFVAAASPVPDDPIVIPLGMTHYSPVKFFIAYLSGKALVSVAGAYIGRYSALSLQGVLPTSEYMVVIAVVSVVIVSVLLKVDLEVIVSKLRKAIGRE